MVFKDEKTIKMSGVKYMFSRGIDIFTLCLDNFHFFPESWLYANTYTFSDFVCVLIDFSFSAVMLTCILPMTKHKIFRVTRVSTRSCTSILRFCGSMMFVDMVDRWDRTILRRLNRYGEFLYEVPVIARNRCNAYFGLLRRITRSCS